MSEEEKEVRRGGGGGGAWTIIDFKEIPTRPSESIQAKVPPRQWAPCLSWCPAALSYWQRADPRSRAPDQHSTGFQSPATGALGHSHTRRRDAGGLVSWQFLFTALSLSDAVFSASSFTVIISVTPGTCSACSLLYPQLLEKPLVEQIESAQ